MDYSFYIVLSSVVTNEKDGSVVNILRENDCFGEMGFLSLSRRIARTIARADGSLMKVNDSDIDRAAEATRLRIHRSFVGILIECITDPTALPQRRRA